MKFQSEKYWKKSWWWSWFKAIGSTTVKEQGLIWNQIAVFSFNEYVKNMLNSIQFRP